MMKAIVKLFTGLLTVKVGLGLVVAPVAAQVKPQARHYKTVKVLKATTTKPRYVQITNKKANSYLYVDKQLKHAYNPIQDYAGLTGVTTYNVKLRLKSGKVVNYTRVRNLHDQFGQPQAGYVRTSYLKTVAKSAIR